MESPPNTRFSSRSSTRPLALEDQVRIFEGAATAVRCRTRSAPSCTGVSCWRQSTRALSSLIGRVIEKVPPSIEPSNRDGPLFSPRLLDLLLDEAEEIPIAVVTMHRDWPRDVDVFDDDTFSSITLAMLDDAMTFSIVMTGWPFITTWTSSTSTPEIVAAQPADSQRGVELSVGGTDEATAKPVLEPRRLDGHPQRERQGDHRRKPEREERESAERFMSERLANAEVIIAAFVARRSRSIWDWIEPIAPVVMTGPIGVWSPCLPRTGDCQDGCPTSAHTLPLSRTRRPPSGP